MPTVWQSMIQTVKINASAGNKSTEILTSEDKIYLVSYKEVYSGTTDTTYTAEGDAIDFFTSSPSRCKFKGYIIPEDVTYYSASTEPSAVSTNHVKEGDIWIHTGNESRGYIYVTEDTVTKYGLTPYATASIGGGWVVAVNWWGRSPYVYDAAYFMSVYSTGYPSSNNANNANAVYPCFSI